MERIKVSKIMIDKELVNIAMNIILYAGDARTFAKEAFNAAMDNDFDLADKKLKDSRKAIEEAHKIHTAVVQQEVNGVIHPFSTLLTHAQDTLMTIYTELNLTENMIQMYKKLTQ
jgi:PTS system cellobiose-specific IIA component